MRSRPVRVALFVVLFALFAASAWFSSLAPAPNPVEQKSAQTTLNPSDPQERTEPLASTFSDRSATHSGSSAIDDVDSEHTRLANTVDPESRGEETLTDDERDYPSLDDAPARIIEARLAAAMDLARSERGIRISEDLIEGVIDQGQVRIIVAQPPSQPALEPRLAGTRHAAARYFDYIPYAAIQVGPQALLDLVESEDVLGIEEDRKNRPTLVDTIPLINADAATAAGFDGTNRVIAVLDTGVDTTHPVFAGRLVDEACFSLQGDCPGGGNREVGPGTGAPCAFNCGHGTIVAGIALGLDPGGIRTGVAPDAGLISVQVFSNDAGDPAAFTSDIVAALEHVYTLRLFHPIAVVNMSLGGNSHNSTAACDAANSARKAAIDLLRSQSIGTVVSSGNDGFTDLISEPGCISTAVSVGSTTKLDAVSGFSNSATFLSLLAPGQAVDSPAMGGGFAPADGTSMAAPHVAGAWASMIEAVPGSNVAEVLFALQSTGVPVLDARNGITVPRIDVSAAITALDAGIDIPDLIGSEANEGLQFVPPPALPDDSCGLVGLDALLALGLVRALVRRRRA